MPAQDTHGNPGADAARRCNNSLVGMVLLMKGGATLAHEHTKQKMGVLVSTATRSSTLSHPTEV